MPTRKLRRGFLGGRLARSLFALFVAAALVPLALSGWLSSTAVGQIADGLNSKARARTTQHTSRQVFERLLVSKALLEAAIVFSERAEPGVAPMGVAGIGRVFQHMTLLADDGRAAWSSDTSSDLVQAWFAAESGWPAHLPRPLHGANGFVEVTLRTDASEGGAPRVLLGATHKGSLRWIAEVHADHIWSPLQHVGHDMAWQVSNPRGQVLAQFQGEDYAADAKRGDIDEDRVAEHRSELFLGGEFGAGDWVFVQRSLRTEVLWHGRLLAVWLGLVGVGTLLAVAILGQRQIRRTLNPLEFLIDGADGLASGASHTRVAIVRDDEIGVLAGAFNHMAEQIEDQFRALEGVAAIDRDILAGAQMDRLARRLLGQLATLYPGASAAVTWRDGETGLMLAQWRSETASVSVVGPTTLRPEQVEAFNSMARDDTGAVGGDPAASVDIDVSCGVGQTTHGEGFRRVLLPVRQEDRTVAVVSLGLPMAHANAPLRPAMELRDRLAVAFAARAREQELVHRALHDSLTGLANREGLHRHLEQWFGEAGSARPAAVMFLDLDHFKDVNDTRGHEAGDELLCLAGERLRACVPPGALVARQGGDEFAIVLPGADEAQARAVAASAIAGLSRPFVLHGGEHVLGASMGIALSPEHGKTGPELLRRADIALYAAKADGRGQYALFTLLQDTVAQDRVRLLGELRSALDRSEFVAHYQPRVRPSDGRITSVEALVRWQHPERGLLFPGAFIGLVESSGLIDRLGHWMLDAACAQMAAWRVQGVPIERVSVNVSPRQLESGELLGQVRSALARHGLSGDHLELEVTESLLVGDATAACEQLSALRQDGVTVALDDFGTGYSSMATLRKLPVDVMKIDRSFVIDLGTDDGAMAVATAIVALARSMGLKLVAEGIETAAQDAVLRAMGCDELQGFLYSRPVAPDVLRSLPGLRIDAVSAVPA